MAVRMVLSPRFKLPLHIIELILVVVAIALSVPGLFLWTQTRTRASTIALGMGAKSIVLIGYQLLSEHVKRFRRWRSLKAYAIINSLEIVFWAAVVFLLAQAIITRCEGTSCILRIIVMVIAILLSLLSFYASAISINMYRESRKTGGNAHDDLAIETMSVEAKAPKLEC